VLDLALTLVLSSSLTRVSHSVLASDSASSSSPLCSSSLSSRYLYLYVLSSLYLVSLAAARQLAERWLLAGAGDCSPSELLLSLDVSWCRRFLSARFLGVTIVY
jgi:hypothetical protein